MKPTYTLRKALEGYWILFLSYPDGTHGEHRFRTKRDAQRWLKLAGL